MQSPDRDPALRVPLLDPFAAAARQPFYVDDDFTWRSLFRRMAKEFSQQLSLAGPLAINLVTANAVACVNLFFVARGGTTQLAAAALGNNVAVMLGRLVLLGLCGALDTLAAQAWGAGKERRLPVLMQRTVVFLWLHCVPISAAMLLLPAGLRALGQDPVLGDMLRRYLMALLPSVWLEAVSRPITRVLVARGIVNPQMVIALLGLPLNVATNYALVVVAGWEYVGAAAAMSAAAGYDLILLLLYVAISGQWSDVVGAPSCRAFKGWRQLARLAYPAASMKCAESWAFTICTLAASLLPDPCTATAAVGVSYNVYGVLFIAFVACSTAACVTVGNRLGAGDARGAKLAAAGSLMIVPPAWGVAAVALLLPTCQNAILALFVVPGGDASGSGSEGDQAALRLLLRHMFVIVCGLVLLDGVQTVLSGIIQGCGRQQAGAIVNLVAFYVFAVPLALGFAFRVVLPAALGGGLLGLGMGPQGLYLGMAAGPAIQTVCYVLILLHTDWEVVSEAAIISARMASTSSLTGLIRRLDPGALMGASLARSGGASSTGIGSMGPSWLMPVIEEHCGEGRDSTDSVSLTAGAGGGGGPADGAARADSSSACNWLQTGSGLLQGAFQGGVVVVLGGEQEGEDGWGLDGPPLQQQQQQQCTGSLSAALEGGAGEGGGGSARRPAPWTPRRQGSRLGGGSGRGGCSVSNSPNTLHLAAAAGAASAASAAAAVIAKGLAPGPSAVLCADVSPGTAARSHALIMTHGSPPRTGPAQHCLLAATLQPSGLATHTSASNLLIVPGSQDSLQCHSPNLPGPMLTHSPPHAAADGSSVPMPVPLPASLNAAAATAAGLADATGAAPAAAGRWFRFGWGRSPGPAPPVKAAVGVVAVRDAPELAAANGTTVIVATASALLQLPGVSTAGSPDGQVTMAAGTGVAGVPGPAVLLSIAAAATAGGLEGSKSRIASLPCPGAGVGTVEEEVAAVPSSVTELPDSGSSGGSGAGLGEMFHSCESLAAAVPGAGDVYGFSAWPGDPATSSLLPAPPRQVRAGGDAEVLGNLARAALLAAAAGAVVSCEGSPEGRGRGGVLF